MALTNKAYTTVDDVKTAMSLKSTTDDDFIQSLISRAQKAIDEYLGFSFQTEGTALAPAERVFDGNGGYQLLVDPILSLSSVKVRSYSYSTDPVTGNITRTQSDGPDISGSIFLGPRGLGYGIILERVNSPFDLGKRNIAVSGVWGKFATIPADIKRACERLVIHYYKQRDANYQNTTANGELGVMVFTQDMPSDICKLLDVHKPRIFRGR